MLVLSRKSGESIRIGEHITVTLIRSRGNRVRLGVDAPSEVEILRSELIEPPEGFPKNSEKPECEWTGS